MKFWSEESLLIYDEDQPSAVLRPTVNALVTMMSSIREAEAKALMKEIAD